MRYELGFDSNAPTFRHEVVWPQKLCWGTATNNILLNAFHRLLYTGTYLVSAAPTGLAHETSSSWLHGDPITNFVSLDFRTHLLRGSEQGYEQNTNMTSTFRNHT
jgi:hypothetical protein